MTFMNRRKFLSCGVYGAGLAGLASAIPAWARGGEAGTIARKGSNVLSGEHLSMFVEDAHFATGARRGPAVTINGTLPGPLLRLKQGQDLTVDLVNNASDGTSIHWHGMLVPFLMDGVPGVTMPAVRSGETFRYRFPIRQSGTYWWHAHTLQEPMGHYGPIIIDPVEPDSFEYDREYVLMLSDWSPMHPHEIIRKLKVGESYFNYHQPSWTDDYPLSAAERRMWARMRMMPTDIADVSGSTYTFLVNGHGPEDGLELAYEPGERIRLRIINGAAMTFFNVRIPGLPMTVVAADGQNILPVETDEFQLGNAETYDVIVEPQGADAFGFVAEAIDRSGMGLATLTSRPGAKIAFPALRKPPLLTMADMGMNMGGSGGHAGSMSGMSGENPQDMHGMSGMDEQDASMAKMAFSGGMNMRDASTLPPNVK
ncbi:MAG: multicopper oxidase domain-containing protein, partial [Pseudomonadota bacterium]|nr:multicopper oxidase domain-containing protein [Pseudomonadota bacterium]